RRSSLRLLAGLLALCGALRHLLLCRRRLRGLLARPLLGLLALALLLGSTASLLLLGAALLLRGPPSLGRFAHGLADRPDHQVAGADRIVVAWDRIRDRHRVDVRVDQADDRNPKTLGLANRDDLGLQVDDHG